MKTKAYITNRISVCFLLLRFRKQIKSLGKIKRKFELDWL
jgi:hypothetical protein